MRIDIHVHNYHGEGAAILAELRNLKEQIMSRLDELKEQIAANAAADKANYDTIADAVVELGTDVAGLDQKIADLQAKIDNPDLTEELQALKDESAASTERAAALAQAIRNAVPTATPAPEPETEPKPVEDAPDGEENPGGDAGGDVTEG